MRRVSDPSRFDIALKTCSHRDHPRFPEESPRSKMYISAGQRGIPLAFNRVELKIEPPGEFVSSR